MTNWIKIFLHMAASLNFIYGLFEYSKLIKLVEYADQGNYGELILIKYILIAIFFEIGAMSITMEEKWKKQ